MEDNELPNQIFRNYLGLFEQEKEIRKDTLEYFKVDNELIDHYVMAGIAGTLIHRFSITLEPSSNDELIIQSLGIRVFNTIQTSVNLALTGYYQQSLSITRDLVEVGFLLDYFSTFPEEISIWMNSSPDDRRKNYSQIEIRKKLDKRDNYTAKMRHQAYKLFSEFASHASGVSHKLLTSEKTGLVTPGPFYDIKLLKTAMIEVARQSIHATQGLLTNFKQLPESEAGHLQAFSTAANNWATKHDVELGFAD